ncbi:histidinol-phosphate transaminase [Xylophilus sp. GOD-11R]|uniref:histidinol-phosphate transaminase n=1 Tax=Xylophilus sp. GOD-11R TaxID=3089814 RepID=UPI00298D414C|nr:histidinol-phosphate transaminase [Xylophilus sp. GOD-11R]WPB55668.1 histidinol-phosphate transaminase [Xylophilus sp. GOD-11R]
MLQQPPPWWSPVVAGLVPYVPGEQPKIERLTKLNTNENPYPPSPAAVQAIRAAATDGLQLYPDPDASALRRVIAARHGLALDEVFVGNGSDEVLAHAFFAFFQQSGAPLLFPDITYSFYKVYCGLYGIPYDTVPLDDQLRVDVEAFARAAGQPNAGVVIASPNAPTGEGLPLATIERLLQLFAQRLVLVDEAYVDFGGESAMSLVGRYPNLLVVQTLSKSRSLAGLRVGFACGQRPVIEALERVKNSFNSYPLDRLAIAGAVAAMQDEAYFDQTRQAVMNTREGLALQLEDMGFEVLPSQANFVFVRHPGHDAKAIATALRAKGVLVRHFSLPRIDQHLRISIGTPEQCGILVDALREILA